jgi:hypothetical protein
MPDDVIVSDAFWIASIRVSCAAAAVSVCEKPENAAVGEEMSCSPDPFLMSQAA